MPGGGAGRALGRFWEGGNSRREAGCREGASHAEGGFYDHDYRFSRPLDGAAEVSCPGLLGPLGAAGERPFGKADGKDTGEAAPMLGRDRRRADQRHGRGGHRLQRHQRHRPWPGPVRGRGRVHHPGDQPALRRGRRQIPREDHRLCRGRSPEGRRPEDPQDRDRRLRNEGDQAAT